MENITAKFKKYKQVFQWLLAAGCLCYIIVFFYNNTEALKKVSQFDLFTIAGLVFLYLLAMAIYCWRYGLVVRKCSGKDLPFGKWFRIFMLGMFLNWVFPQMGNLYRTMRVKKDFQISYTRYISSYFSFGWLDIALNLTIALTAVLVFAPAMRFGSFGADYFIGSLLAIVAVAPFILNAMSIFLRGRVKYFQWLHSKLSEVFSVTVANIRDVRYISKFALTGIVSFFNTALIFYLCFRSIDVEVGLPVLALFLIILKLSNLIILTPGNLGVRELAYGFLGQMAGIGMAEALLVSIVVRIVGTSVVLGMGLIFGGAGLIRKRKDYTEADINSN